MNLIWVVSKILNLLYHFLKVCFTFLYSQFNLFIDTWQIKLCEVINCCIISKNRKMWYVAWHWIWFPFTRQIHSKRNETKCLNNRVFLLFLFSWENTLFWYNFILHKANNTLVIFFRRFFINVIIYFGKSVRCFIRQTLSLIYK